MHTTGGEPVSCEIGVGSERRRRDSCASHIAVSLAVSLYPCLEVFRVAPSDSIRELVEFLRREPGAAYLRVSHGMWDVLVAARQLAGWPVAPSDFAKVDAGLPYSPFFESGVASSFLSFLPWTEHCTSEKLLIEWGTGGFIGRSKPPEFVAPCEHEREFLEQLVGQAPNNQRACLMKSAVQDGSILALIEYLQDCQSILVGPPSSRSFAGVLPQAHSSYLAISNVDGIWQRLAAERHLEAMLRAHRDSPRQVVVVMQASVLGFVWALRLKARYPRVQWLDMGLAMSLINLEPEMHRLWFATWGQELLTTAALARQSYSRPDFDNVASAAILSPDRADQYFNVIHDSFLPSKSSFDADLKRARDRVELCDGKLSLPWLKLSETYQREHYNEAALSCLNAAIALKRPGDWKPLVARSRLYEMGGRISLAADDAEAAWFVGFPELVPARQLLSLRSDRTKEIEDELAPLYDRTPAEIASLSRVPASMVRTHVDE